MRKTKVRRQGRYNGNPVRDYLFSLEARPWQELTERQRMELILETRHDENLEFQVNGRLHETDKHVNVLFCYMYKNLPDVVKNYRVDILETIVVFDFEQYEISDSVCCNLCFWDWYYGDQRNQVACELLRRLEYWNATDGR